MIPLIYLDYNATTPVDPRVLEAMLPYLREKFGNAASRSHSFGQEAKKAVDQARSQVAGVLNARAEDIIWTSGATESNNIALQGIARMHCERGRHIITQATEHKAVLDPCKCLEQEGFRVTYLSVSKTGRIDLNQLREAMTDDTILVSIMYANNEIGTVQPIAEIGRLCKERGILFHTDATQAFGKLPIDVQAMGIDLLSLSAHKIYGPKGVGALYVRGRNPHVRCKPIMHGGGHERGMRSGTLNTPGIVGLGAAAQICHSEMPHETRRLAGLRDRLWSGLTERIDEVCRNGDAEHCLPNTLNVSFAYIEGEGLMMGFSNVAVSSGSACTSASLEPSYVLAAIGVSRVLAQTSIRFSLGRFTTSEEIEQAIPQVSSAVIRLRDMSPLYEMAKEGIDLETVNWERH